MGALCTKAEAAVPTLEERNDKLCRGIFDRFDKDKSGFITKENLKQIIQDDKTFRNTDVDHILSKYGTDGKMSYENFKFWWNSTYTTYNDDNINDIMAELEAEGATEDASALASPPRQLATPPPRPLGDTQKLRSTQKIELEEGRSWKKKWFMVE